MIACSAVLTACGEDERPTAARSTPTPTPTVTATATPTATATATATATPAATATPEGGDESGNRFPLPFILTPEDILPPELPVPAFLGLRMTITNQSGNERIVRLDDKVIAELNHGESEELMLEGLQPGEHILSAGESGRSRILAERAGEE